MTKNRSPVALVTGASRGIGAACARRLAAEGMAVAINSHPDERWTKLAAGVASDIQASGGRAAVYPADVTDATAVDAMFERCEAELGVVRALVLNAAAIARRPWNEIPDAEWDWVSAVNLRGAFLCCRRAFGGPDRLEDGAIVTVGSVLAESGARNALHYAATKAGLLGFTRSLARELGGQGIRVNCVVPGAIQTEEEFEAYPDQEELERIALGRQSLQRRGLADDIAGAVSFLVGPDSTFITGQTLCVDGGWLLT